MGHLANLGREIPYKTGFVTKYFAFCCHFFYFNSLCTAFSFSLLYFIYWCNLNFVLKKDGFKKVPLVIFFFLVSNLSSMNDWQSVGLQMAKLPLLNIRDSCMFMCHLFLCDDLETLYVFGARLSLILHWYQNLDLMKTRGVLLFLPPNFSHLGSKGTR